MRAKRLGKTLNDLELRARIQPLRRVDNVTNFVYIGREYLTLAAALTGIISICEASPATVWGWTISVASLMIGVLVIGACQHRLGGLGHEGAHYMLFRNRTLNELASDTLCMFPLFLSTDQYRPIHLGHHDYTNDWDHDPELLNLADVRKMADFPMHPSRFIWQFGISLVRLPTLVRYICENFYVSALGMGVHPYMLPGKKSRQVRTVTWLGIGYVAFLLAAVTWGAVAGSLAVLWPLAGMFIAACVVVAATAESKFFRCRLRAAYSPKITSILRLGWFTGLAALLLIGHVLTGVNWLFYFVVLWIVPMFTVFPYLMLMRDLFQHANADDGRLTNSRNIYCHPVLRWAMFIYGQDMHLTHHLVPGVPHYNLRELDRVLREHNAEYAEHAVECHGVFRRRFEDKPTLLEVMHLPTTENSGAVGIPPLARVAANQHASSSPRA